MESVNLIGFALFIALIISATASASPCLLPDETAGWRAAERFTFDRTNLFDFIDGGAEVYLAYNFRQVSVVTYNKEDSPQIAAEAYDMGNAYDAFGVLSVDLTGEKAPVGSEARYGAGLLRFCKGRWFVRILAEQETDQTRSAVFDLGHRIADTITEDSPRPRILSALPMKSLLPDSITYFHTKTTLNQLYYLADDNILLLGPETEAVIADYRAGDSRIKLLIISYRDRKKCLKAWQSFRSLYLHDKSNASSEAQLIRGIEKERFVGLTQHGSYLIVVLDAPASSAAKDLLEAATKKLEGAPPHVSP